jgi:hypothetical protein
MVRRRDCQKEVAGFQIAMHDAWLVGGITKICGPRVACTRNHQP